MANVTRAHTLTRDRVLGGAIELADAIGVEAFTIRRLATVLETKPMTIYHYVESKDAIIDGMVDIVFAQIELPPADIDWREAMRRRCRSAREVLARHPWAPPLMESRQDPGPATLRHHDAVLGCLRRAGLSLAMTAHAYAILDSYVYGFALEEAHLPGSGGAEMVEMAATLLAERLADYPYLAEFTTEHVLQPGYRFSDSFDFGLELILDGLALAAERDVRARSTELLGREI